MTPANAAENVLADYDAELRLPNGHVDTGQMVSRLKELGVNTYFWLVYHAPTDWKDLKLFLPKAAQAGINVWVYLVPPSESAPHGKQSSEPYRLDYQRWATAIARLSLQATNLTGWVIDDFDYNRTLFTPDYVRRMQSRAKAINPHLVFLPLMYFNQINARFVEDYGGIIDGVVVAYPNGRGDIERARATLNPSHIPFIVMNAAEPAEFRKRHGKPASPQRLAEWLRTSLQAWHDGQCDGVVTYCLDKQSSSRDFDVVRTLFRKFAPAKTPK